MSTLPARVVIATALALVAALAAGCGPAANGTDGNAGSAGVDVSTSSNADAVSNTAPPSSADSQASPEQGAIHTPQPGSEERTAILDAVRKFHDTSDKYVVHEMLVQGDWALCTVSPEGEQDSVVSYLAVHRKGGRWVDVVASDSGETEDWKAAYRQSWIDSGVPDSLVAAYQFKTR